MRAGCFGDLYAVALDIWHGIWYTVKKAERRGVSREKRSLPWTNGLRLANMKC